MLYRTSAQLIRIDHLDKGTEDFATEKQAILGLTDSVANKAELSSAGVKTNKHLEYDYKTQLDLIENEFYDSLYSLFLCNTNCFIVVDFFNPAIYK